MQRSIKVAISGREYSLLGDNEELIMATAEEVNNHINLIVSNHGDLPDKTVNVLAALNLAEEKLKTIEKSNHDKLKLINELNSMAESLREAVST